MERIVARCDELASVLLGYGIDAGWRSQDDLIIIVPYKEWKLFNQQYMSIRVNVMSDRPQSFMRDLSLALYNELYYSSFKGKNATLIIPSSDEKPIMRDTYIEFLDMLSLQQLQTAYSRVEIGIRNYYRCLDPNAQVSTALNMRRLSEWNKLVYKIALSYQLHDSPLNINWR